MWGDLYIYKNTDNLNDFDEDYTIEYIENFND